jgi:hypothetical protein
MGSATTFVSTARASKASKSRLRSRELLQTHEPLPAEIRQPVL